MAKGLCPGVGRSHEKESVEKTGRERERPIFLGVRGKPIRPLHRTCTAHEGTGHPPEEILKAQAGKCARQASRSKELAVEKEKEPQPLGFWHQNVRYGVRVGEVQNKTGTLQ